MIPLIEQHREEIISLCVKYGVRRLELFGSAATGAFSPDDSDVDFLYEFSRESEPGLADRYFEFQESLEALLGVKVDLVSSLDACNPYFLQIANQSRVELYAA